MCEGCPEARAGTSASSGELSGVGDVPDTEIAPSGRNIPKNP